MKPSSDEGEKTPVSAAAPTHLISVDPGIKGAICLFEIRTRKVQVFDMPTSEGRVDPAKLAAIVDQLNFQADRHVHAVVELVSSMPRQAGAFNFGVSAGVVHGVLAALGIPMTLVSPNVWKGATGLHRMPGESQADVKSRARFLAQKLWPAQAALFARVKDDGRAEACLISFFYATKMGWL
jgi:crossover junction endodeoxyribonuclease RuvC